jgi:hypothetical protein
VKPSGGGTVLLIEYRETLSDRFYVDRTHEFPDKLQLPFESASCPDSASHFYGLFKSLIINLDAVEVGSRQAHQAFAHLLQRMHLPFALTFTGPLLLPFICVTIGHRLLVP